MAQLVSKTDRLPEFHKRVLAALANAAEITGIDVVEFGKHLISTPVPPRSTPGNPPHKETGELQANLQHDVDADGQDRVVLTFTTSRPSQPEVPYILEMGIGIGGPRPYFAKDKGEGSMWGETRRIAGGIAKKELEKVK